MADSMIVQIFTQGREIVGEIDKAFFQAFHNPYVTVQNACQVLRYAINPQQIKVEMRSVGKDPDYATSSLHVSTVGAVMIELDPSGETAKLWQRVVSIIEQPGQGILRA